MAPKLSGLIARFGIGRAMVGGSRGWLALGAAGTAWRILRKAVVKEPQVVYSEKLSPGRRLVISHLEPAPRRRLSGRRRRAAKMER